MKLEGRVALVTGGGSGIGRAIAHLFAEEGARVIVNDVALGTAEETVAQMGPAGQHALALKADVSSSAAVNAMFAQVAERCGGLDILVNNAGIGEMDSARGDELRRRADARIAEMRSGGEIRTHLDITAEMTDEEWNRMMAVHVTGTFYCTRAALKLMAAKNRGAIINLSSVAALDGLELAPHYSAAKGAILSFTRAVAKEAASRNIRVNAICPGWVETPMAERAFTPTLKKMLFARIPMGRAAQPREVATTALFLACDDSSYFTGQWLSPNGGLFTG
ncbi:MAG TPA: SDR family oxidoreductase [Candidatus Acidoferrales bacterium]|nr:SDR family oxidoreductase [Candidatus Acidoferrales bacterium]